MRLTLIAMLLVIAACAEQPGMQPATPSATPAASANGVAVTLTGAPAVDGDGAVTWCPGSSAHEGCAGIPVTGLPADTVEVFDQSPMWKVDGTYDGVTVRATGAPEPVSTDDADPDFTTPCADLRGQSSEMGNMDVDASDAVERYLATIPDRHAATWWDSANAVMTVLLTGDDVAEHRAALEEAVGDRGTVCVVGGARWSAAELGQMQQRALDIAVEEDMGPWGSGTDAVANRVQLDVERSDMATVDRIREEVGEAVQVRSFLAVRDGTIGDLPATPARGDVELETAETRGGAGMDALGTFTVRFDADQRCVYGEFGSDRAGLIWPFGYWAESDPLRVYDQDGRLVASEGDLLESGGGNAPRDGAEVCGTSDVWAMNGPPQVVGPSEG